MPAWYKCPTHLKMFASIMPKIFLSRNTSKRLDKGNVTVNLYRGKVVLYYWWKVLDSLFTYCYVTSQHKQQSVVSTEIWILDHPKLLHYQSALGKNVSHDFHRLHTLCIKNYWIFLGRSPCTNWQIYSQNIREGS